MTMPTLRLSELDAVRGWAALSVVVFHVFWETFGVVEPSFRNPVTAPFINGDADVAIFFVLSGDVLVYGFLATGNPVGIQRTAIKRYLRLTLPITAASALVWALVHLKLSWWDQASVLVHRGSWFSVLPRNHMTLGDLLYYSFRDVYSPHPSHEFISFLWTMRIELFGSAAVILYAFVQQRIACKKIILAALIAWLYSAGSDYAPFFVGVMIAQARTEGVFERDFKLRSTSSSCLIVAGLLLSDLDMQGFHWTARPSTAIAILIVIGIVGNQPLCAFLARNKVSQFLGHLSFPLYLVHLIVIIGPMSWAIVWADRRGLDTTLDHLAIALATVAVCVVSAWMFSPVERGTAIVNRFVVAAAEGRVRGWATTNRIPPLVPAATLGIMPSGE
jgi:peptidoglycan/LPS O-acetylase OafA/YrhL